MNSEIFVEKFNDFPVNRKELLRYAGCQGTDDEVLLRLADSVVDEVLTAKVLSYNVCYRQLPVSYMEEDEIDFDFIRMRSKDLTKCLGNCDEAIFLAATVGQGIDRIIRKYNSTDSARALFMQALGAERVETMLDYFCQNFSEVHEKNTGERIKGLRPRFSPGYGDLSLSVQPEFIRLMDASRKIGITINDSLLMSPSKSVTAIAGIIK